jgi:diguanylate cyclase (GGDEF)-like protein
MLQLTHKPSMDTSGFAQPRCCTNILLIETQGDASMLAALFEKVNSGLPASHHQLILHRARNVSEGLDALAQGGIDIVILIPGTNGLKPLFQILEGEPGVPVVILDNCDDEARACQAIRAGAQDCLLADQLTRGDILRSLRYAIERHQFLRKASLTDDLTDLHNRRGFITLAEQQLKIARAQRTEASLMLAFVDIDGLKQINDRFGHEAGSDAICDAALALRNTFREVDVVGRLGGDEFGVLIVNPVKDSEATILRRMNDNIEALNQKKVNPYRLSLSIGLTQVDPKGAATIEDLIAKADDAMYVQKRSKANGSVVARTEFGPRKIFPGPTSFLEY